MRTILRIGSKRLKLKQEIYSLLIEGYFQRPEHQSEGGFEKGTQKDSQKDHDGHHSKPSKSVTKSESDIVEIKRHAKKTEDTNDGDGSGHSPKEEAERPFQHLARTRNRHS